MDNITNVSVKDNIANPAPLGLFAFGLTTVLLNIKNAGIIDLSSMILCMGIFYGGTAQVIAGYLEAKKNNTFGLTAFTSYGFFWLTLVGLIVLPKTGLMDKPNDAAMIAFLGGWGVFTLLLFFATLNINRALQVVFGSLTILFFLLAAAHATKSEAIEHLAGFEGIFCGLTAIYTGIAQIYNEVYGRVVLPIGPVSKK